jgi:HEAT repeat protein
LRVALAELPSNPADLTSAAHVAVPLLIRFTYDSHPQVRSGAAEAMGGFYAADPGSLAALSRLLSDPDAETRTSAIKALGLIGPSARAAIPARLAYVRSTRASRERVLAICALAEIDKDAAASAGFDVRLVHKP